MQKKNSNGSISAILERGKMKYIIMCGGDYSKKFETPKQLLKVNGEIIVERTIRLLKENGIKDIAISTNNPAFDYLNVPILHHQNEYTCWQEGNNRKSKNTWLQAYYPAKEPCCYLHGDVYFSEEAIKTIVNTKVKDTMFFCIPDIQDGRKDKTNPKGREPLAYKVENMPLFRKAVDDLLNMVEEGKFAKGVEPISWHVYRYLHGLDLCFDSKNNGGANDIFKTKGDYIAIDDYTTDIDGILDIARLDYLLNEGGREMIKVEVIEGFTLKDFNCLKNIVRRDQDKKGELFVGDTFECDEAMVKYLSGENRYHRAYIKVIEILPKEEPKEEPKIIEKITTPVGTFGYGPVETKEPKPKKKKTSKK
jgi:hypothetical protein